MSPLLKNRDPVGTYEQALNWLVKHWGADWRVFLGADNLPPEARLVADMYWVTDAQLRHHVTRLCKQLDAASSPAPRRKSWEASWLLG